jgi:RNA polymerase primary sigma factor
LTQHQLQELLESEQARPFIEQGEERGHIEPIELEAFAVEHDLGEEEIEQLTRELEAIGLEVREARAESEKAGKIEQKQPDPDAVVGSADSLQLFLADVGRHKLLTAAEEVALAKRIERGDLIAKREMIESNLRLVVSIAKG